MKILVKTPSGKIFEFKVKFKDTIQSIKEKIEYKEDIPLEDQRLVFGGKELEDYRIIGEYNIQDNQTINLLIKLKSINKIIVKDLNEKEINLDTNSSDTIKNIKEKIKDKEGILPNQYKLVLDGKQLEEDKTVEFYNIKNDSNLQLVPLDVFQICIHKTYGEKIIIDVNNFDTIKNIKKKIENQEGIPIEQQVLLFNGEKLKDINIIYLNKIQKDSVILLTLRNIFKIFVETINGNTITLNVKPSDTIKEIKEQIKNKLVIPFYRQNYFLMDKY